MGSPPRRDRLQIPHLCALFPIPLAILLNVFVAALLLGGCATQATPDLLEITELGPSTLETGSEIRVVGAGFPEGRPGTLRFLGTMHAPARRPRAVEWNLPFLANSQGEITLRVGAREIAEQLQGSPHATFRGDAQVEFEPIKRGRPILRGSKEGLVLDLFGSAGSTQEDENAFVAFLGTEVDKELKLTQVVKDGVASRAGLEVGDRLLVLDGVRVDSRRDLLPQAATGSSMMEVARPGQDARLEAVIDRRDFQLLDQSVATRALAAFTGVLLALVWAARPPRFFLWLLGSGPRSRNRRSAWLSGVPEARQVLVYPVFLVVLLGTFWLLSTRAQSVQLMAFVGCLALGSLMLLLSSFLLGGTRSKGDGFSLSGALSSTFLRGLMLIPVFLAAFYRASEVGSLNFSEIAGQQAALPSGWGIFASPCSFILAVSYLVVLLPLSGRRAPLYGHPGNFSSGLAVSRLIEWAGIVLLIAVWIVAFLGAAQGGTPGGFIAGALLSTKIAAVAHALRWAQAQGGGLRLSESWSLFGLTQILLSMLLFFLGFSGNFLGFSSRHSEALGLFAVALALASALLFFISSQRSWAHAGRRVDLWI